MNKEEERVKVMKSEIHDSYLELVRYLFYKDLQVLLEKKSDLNVINMARLPGLLKWSFISM